MSWFSSLWDYVISPSKWFSDPLGLELFGLVKKPELPKFPEYLIKEEIPEVPTLTVEEIEAQEMGWQQVLKRAQGRRGTILTEPMLSQTQPYTQRPALATTLAG